MTSRQKWTLALTSAGALMVALDALVVAAALTHDQAGPAAVDRPAGVDGQRVQPRFAVLLMTGGGARRPVRPAADVRRRARAVHARLGRPARWRRRPAVLIAARAVQGAGAAVVHAAGDGAAHRARSRRSGAARRSASSAALTGLAVARRPGRRRRGDRGPRLAVDLLDQRAGRRWSSIPLGTRRIAREHGARHAGSTCRRSPCHAWRARRSSGVWSAATSAGWASAEVLGCARRRRRAAGGVRGLGAARAEPMVPLRLLPPTGRSPPANAPVFLLTAALFSAVFFFAQFCRSSFGCEPAGGRAALLPWTATLFVVAPVAGRLVDRIGERPLVGDSGWRCRPPAWSGWRSAVAHGDGYADAGRCRCWSPAAGSRMALPASAECRSSDSVPPRRSGSRRGSTA